ncbi:YihY/virulence factor BrkB family protein, partial [Singulisphaera rosea]
HLPLRLREAISLGGLTVRELVVRTWKKVIENEIMTRAAAVAFYGMLALVPFLGLTLVFAVQLLPDVTGRSRASLGLGNLTVETLETTLKSLFPKEAFEVVKDQIGRMQHEPPVGLISVGLIITIWLASSLFVAIIDAMNRIYGVVDSRPIWKLRLVAIVMTVVQAAILVGSLLAIVAWPQILRWMGLRAHEAAIATAVQGLVVFLMLLLSFALTFYFGPDAEQRWEWITPGSIAGALIFLAVTYGFRAYVQNFANYNKTYGSLGGVMVLLFWFWITSLIVLTSGQINKIIEEASPLGKAYGQKINPDVKPDFSSMSPEPIST